MSAPVFSLIGRDVRLAAREGGGAFLALAFFVVASLGNLSHMIALKAERDAATA